MYRKDKTMGLKKALLLLVIMILSGCRLLFADNGMSLNVNQYEEGREGAHVSDLWIDYGATKVFGQISMPSCSRKKKVAIVSHGFNGGHSFGQAYFDTLNKLGYMVYTFDFPCGSIYSRSDNNTMNMSVVDEKNVLKAIVKYFQRRSDVDPSNIVLIGESQGGLVSALAAADMKKEISRLVLIYPALCIPDNWNKRYPHVEDIPDTTKVWNVPLGRRYFEEARKINVYAEIVRYKGPVLIIHGAKDSVVPLSYSEEAQRRYRKALLHVLPTAGHGFNAEERCDANRLIGEFLR